MTQSLHLPEIREGLSNPLYPHFQPLHNIRNSMSEGTGDSDLLEAYGLDFNKFNVTNGDSSSIINPASKEGTSETSISNIDDPFNLTINSSVARSPNNWTKFE